MERDWESSSNKVYWTSAMRLLLEHGVVADVYYDFAGSIIPWTSRCRTSVHVHNADDRPDVSAGSEDRSECPGPPGTRGYRQCTRQNPPYPLVSSVKRGAVGMWGYYLSTGRT